MRAGRDPPDLADESVFITIQSIHKDCYPQSVNMFSFQAIKEVIMHKYVYVQLQVKLLMTLESRDCIGKKQDRKSTRSAKCVF